MSCPSRDECYQMMDKYHLPENVRKHIEQVRILSVFISKKLKATGITIDIDLVESAALLHDILRPIDFKEVIDRNRPENVPEDDFNCWVEMSKKYPNMYHTDAGYELFKSDYPELALIIRKHAYIFIVSKDPMKKPITWEEKVVNYADKRVAHDKIMTLKERFAEGHTRWKKNHPEKYKDMDAIRKVDNAYVELEKELFSIININPDRIEDYIKEENHT